MSDAPAIRAENLSMVFGAEAQRVYDRTRAGGRADFWTQIEGRGLIPAVRDVSFDIARGELFVIMGLSGSGKSTVIRCLSRLLEPTAGRVAVFGEDILKARKGRMRTLRRERFGMVFQHFGLFPHMSVRDNVAFPLRVQGVAAAERAARAERVITLVGLEGREDAFPRQLSGGQRQRVGIARSLVADPDIWFLDEPFSALDPLIRRQLQDEFLTLQAELNKSIVFITHDIAEALKLADRIAIMRDGAVVQMGTPADIVLNPVDRYVADFTRDIAPGKLMRVETVMEPGGLGADGGPALAPAMTLDAATQLFLTHGAKTLPVRDGQGAAIGQLSAQALARALGAAS